MTKLTISKLVLALSGLALFGAGIRFEVNALRWVGLGLVAVAWGMRFISPSTKGRGQDD